METLFGLEHVLVKIFEKLVFADQLSLAQVNSAFKRIFASYIVAGKSRKLKISKRNINEAFIASNGNSEGCMILTQDEITNLLKFGCDYVNEFHVIGDCEWDIDDFLWGHLQNLTCLCCEDLYITEKSLLLIADNCSNLRELQLIRCRSSDEDEYEDEYEDDSYSMLIGEIVSISTLEKMMKLKSLEIQCASEWSPPITMSSFCELITKVSLECLKLDAVLQPDVDGNLYERTIHHNLKELEIVIINCDCETLKCLERLGVFKTLLKLHIFLADDVTDSALQILSKACENLECLTFCEPTNFEITKQFQIPPNLKELSFLWCQGLKDEHIKDALTKFKIEIFRCKDLESRLLNDFIISPHIRVLDLQGVSPPQFSSVHCDNITLMELHWDGEDLSDSDNTERRECLKTCRNLETLVIHSGFVPLDVILELKHLKKLHILNSTDWSCMISLFKHPSLKELYIDKVDLEELQIPAPGFPSTITLVKIPFDVLKLRLDFWLNMLQQNLKMSISCHSVWYDEKLLEFPNIIVHHEKLPKDIKNFKIWGFNLNCKDLRDNYMPTIQQLEKMFRLLDYLPDENNTVVLSR